MIRIVVQLVRPPFANAIACLQNGGSFKPINSKASTQDGLNPSTVGLDEVHAHKTHDLLNVLKLKVPLQAPVKTAPSPDGTAA